MFRSKLILIFVLFSVIISIVSSYSFISIGSHAIEDRVRAQFDSVATLKASQFLMFMETEKDDVVRMSDDIVVHSLIHSGKSEDTAITSLDDLDVVVLRRLVHDNIIGESEDFEELFLMGLDGKVVVSTDARHEGVVEADQGYFLSALNATYVQGGGPGNRTGEESFVIAVPIKATGGRVIGVVAGKIRRTRMTEIVSDWTGLGETGETFLVDKYNYFITTPARKPDYALNTQVYTAGVNDCLAGHSGSKHFDDYRGVAVFGVYKWIPEYDVCLMSKIDDAELFVSMRGLMITTVFIGCGTAFIAILVGIWLSFSIYKPLNALGDIANDIGKGDLDVHNIKRTYDEFGDLGRTLVVMAHDLRKYQGRLLNSEKHQKAHLVSEVNRKTQELRRAIGNLENTRLAMLNIMEDMRQANSHLQELDKAKDEFLNLVSHELKTPLTPIKAHLELLADGDMGKLSKLQMESVHTLSRSTDRLNGIIMNLLEIARINTGKIQLNIDRIRPDDIAKQVYDDISLAGKEKGIKVSLQCGKTGFIRADRGRVRECLSNFATNALKFTEKGSITIFTRMEKGVVRFSVTDTGIGIKQEDQHRLFEKFFQAGRQDVGKPKGVGLGLYSVRKIIELHGGEVGVESEFGKGSTFWFALPRRGGGV